MILKKLIITVIAAWSFGGIIAAEMPGNVLWQDNFKILQTDNEKAKTGWCFKHITAKIVNDSLRIRESGRKHYGKFYRYIPFNLKSNKANYLQFKMAQIEQPNSLSARNASSKGKQFGPLYAGWNTFDLTAQPKLCGRKSKFALSITQFGVRGTGQSSYADIELIRIVKTPLDGLTVTLQGSTEPARSGDKLLFSYYASGKLAKAPQVKCYITPSMAVYNLTADRAIILNDAGENGDAIAGDNIYSVVAVIDKIGPRFVSSKKIYLLAAVTVNGVKSSAIVNFSCNINADSSVVPPVTAASSDGGQYHKLWQKATQGTNLALGKPVIFSKKSSYRLSTKGGTDATDLTDGKLSDYKKNKIWFDSKTVGWYNNQVVNGVNLIIDLGTVQPIDKVVIRCLAGKAQQILVAPQKFELFVSKDGQQFHRTATMQKLQPGEKSQSDLKRFFYIEEAGKPYVYPFILQANADARYIGLRIYGDADSIFSDELAVIKAKKAQITTVDYNRAYSKTAQKLHTNGFIVKPRCGKLVIGKNILVPNSLAVEDMSGKKKSRPQIGLIIETPPQIVLVKPDSVKTTVTIKGKRYSRWTLPMKWLHSKRPLSEMLFFSASSKLPANATATFYVDYPGVKIIKSTVPVSVIDFPIVTPKLKRLHVSLTWMSIRNSEAWPRFLKEWKKLGFNAVACFPRAWRKNTADRNAFLTKARHAGYKVVMNESPFHVMIKPFRKKPGAEIFSQIPNGKSKNLCPSYRGQYYVKELERVTENVKKSQPDYVFWDIECWYRGAREASSCSRCKAGQQKSGKPLAEYLRLQGQQSFADLYVAVEKGSVGRKMPIVASYNHHAVHPVHHGVTDFNLIFPQYVKQAQPSLYVAGRALDVHNSIRKNYQLTKSRNIVPWLSTGTYGEFESSKVEPMILEALLNGATGITYYWYGDFDTSLDFYYHAKALAEIAPYENLIMDGQVIEPTGSNTALTYSGIRNGNEMLLLIGNYTNTNPSTVFVTPFNEIAQIKDLRSGKRVKPEVNLELKVPRGDIRLLYIKGKAVKR